LQPRPEEPKRAYNSLAVPWRIVWIAFLIRVAYMTVAHTYRFRRFSFGDNFQFGFEMGRIGRALATGYGFADPFNGHTGPTAWVGPLYPLLIGGVFKLLGVYTLKSAWLLLAINCLLSALIVRPVWEIASRCFNRRVALWSAWIWALYPAAMQYAVRWVWEMTLTTLLFSWVLVLALRMRNIGGEPAEAEAAMTKSRWACFGLLWGLIALSNASLLAFLPFCGLWILAGAGNWKRQIAGVVISSVLCLACIAPWTYRNWLVFHQFVPLRGNLGAELYLGNGPGAVGLLMGFDHPNEALDQLALYNKMGEIPYAKYRGHLAMTYIVGDPVRFAVLCAKRVYYFWAGAPHPQGAFVAEYGRSLNFAFTSTAGLLGLALALRRRAPGAVLFGLAFLTLPAVYYFITVHARFRHPLEPLITILGVYLFQSATPRRRASAGDSSSNPRHP
jgi:4-amino-4-deoxy-L-arabinose transferase-like glycosyltransferase